MKYLHSMIRVKDENKAKEFYCDLLGLKLANRVRLEDCYLQYLLDEATNTEIELTINDEKQDYTNGSAFGHFAFECENLDEFDKKMKQKGYNWEVEPFVLEQLNIKIAFLNDPDGNSVELIQKL